MHSLNDLFEDMLQDVYYAEKKILKALPKMAKKSKSKELSGLFTAHLAETEGQVDRLEQVFKILGSKPKAKTCHAIEGLVEEADDVMKEAEDADVCNAGMLADAQAVEHYEMARYGALIAWAKQLKMPDAAKLLEQTLAQEKAADQKTFKALLVPERRSGQR
jgi:ferritin-like metal-binding protein YciE